MMRGTVTAMDGFCAAKAKARTKRRFWLRNAKTGCCRSLQRKRAFPRPARRFGHDASKTAATVWSAMTTVAGSLSQREKGMRRKGRVGASFPCIVSHARKAEYEKNLFFFFVLCDDKMKEARLC